MGVRQVLAEVEQLLAPLSHPASSDPAAPPLGPGVQLFVNDRGWGRDDDTDGYCPLAPITAQLDVVVYAGGAVRDQVDALRDAVFPIADALYEAGWHVGQIAPGNVDKSMPAYIIPIEKEVIP